MLLRDTGAARRAFCAAGISRDTPQGSWSHVMANEPLTPAQSRIKAATVLLTTVAGCALLLHDWGPGTVFSGVRPAVKSVLNRVYGTQPQQSNPEAKPDNDSHLTKPFVPSGSISSPSEAAANGDEGTDAAKAPHRLNVAAAEFVPGAAAGPSPTSAAQRSGSSWPSRSRRHGYDASMTNGSSGYDYADASAYGDSSGYQYGDGSAVYSGYGEANGTNGYEDANGYGQVYEGGSGEEQYSTGAEDGYDQHEGAYANGTSTNGTHNAVYNSLFDDSPAEQNSAHFNTAYQNGHLATESGAADMRSVSRIEAMMAVLSQQYPAYSQGSLREILDLRGGDMGAALDMLSRNEAAAPTKADHGRAAGAPSQKPPTLDETNFPSLGSPSPSKAPSPSSTSPEAPQNPAGGFAAALQKPAAEKHEVPATTNGHANAAAKEVSKDAGEHKGRTEPRSGSPTTAVPWVETGESVAAQYNKLRQEARDHCRMRNMCFQQATQAYQAGNKALAKELGAKGREHADKMQAAHAVASEAIFRERNAHREGQGALKLIDLHGLHVTEAVDALRREVKAARARRQAARQPGTERVSVIVGTGHHTKGKHAKARLPAGVQEWLEQEKIAFRQPTPGMLELAV
ncbi:hypothetical protein WJX73_003072 [Symbiochloris irregularis]|uniref:Smr domain-containing protein n=1 Tax=Symbiochloris irregularis TaxID=706552 RepID=A0AAW1PEH0_9CHLO